MEFRECFRLVWILYMLCWICCFPMINGHILICATETKQLMEEFSDMPAQFGGIIPSTGIKVFLKTINKDDFGCKDIIPPRKNDFPFKAHFAILIQRGNCTFEEKIRNAQASNYSVAIIYNNRSDDLEHMSAKNTSGIHIASVFIGKTAGTTLKGFNSNDIYLIIDDELPFNINTQLILPFCILLGICFLIMILYMIYKCVRAERRLRRHRLPKRLLRKLPIMKYTKNGDLPYDTCVICLDEFIEGDKLRILPCKHAYHSKCIDPWLTKSKRECPICKRKLFTKRESRLQRIRRQSPLDSVTDTEDDTTPLMQQSNTSAASSSLNRNFSNSSSYTNSHTSTTRHGTFRRNARSNSDVGQQFSSTGSDGGEHASESTDTEMLTSAILRVNPFDRQPNLPAHLDAHLNAEPTNQRSIRSWSIAKRLLRFDETEPPYQDILDDVVTGMPGNNNTNRTNNRATMNTASRNVGRRYVHDEINDDDDDDDEEPMLSIYEPANCHTPFVDILEAAQQYENILNLTDDDVACFHTPPSSDLLTSDPVQHQEVVQHNNDDASAHHFA